MSDAVKEAIRTAVAAAESSTPSLSGGSDAAPEGALESAASSIEVAEAAAPVEGETPAPAAAAATADPTAPKAPAAPAEDDEFAKEHGVKSKDTLGRNNKIPYDVVKTRIVPNAVKKAEATWTTEKLQPVVQERDRLKVKVDGIQRTEDIMFNDQRQFLSILRTIPGYAELLDAAPAPGARHTAPEPGDLPDAASDPRPGPDWVDPATGKPAGFTPEGHEKLLDWQLREAERRAVARLEKRYGPVATAYETTQKRREETAKLEHATNGVLEDAAVWPGFKENFSEIEKVLPSIPNVNPDTGKPYSAKQALRLAYDKVVPPRLRQTEDELRKKILDEMAAAPRGTSTTGTTTAQTADAPLPGETATHFAVRKAIAAAERG